jgi:hypothetical protein
LFSLHTLEVLVTKIISSFTIDSLFIESLTDSYGIIDLASPIIFPSPFVGKIFIKIPEDQYIINVILFDQTSKLVNVTKLSKALFYFNNQTNGLYFVIIGTNYGIFKQKIIKI